MNPLDRIWAFECAVQERQAERIERFDTGTVIETPAIPRVYDANLVRFDRRLDELDANGAIGIVERFQAHLGHRRFVVAGDAAGARLAAACEPLGWKIDRHLTMPYEGERRAPERSPRVREVATGEVARLRSGTSGAGDQMAEFHARMARAVETHVFAAVGDDGAIGAWCSLYREGGVAQIEDVETLEPQRGRGLARAVVGAALATALDGGDETIFILADEADWPKEWYARMGFVEHARRWLFTKGPTF